MILIVDDRPELAELLQDVFSLEDLPAVAFTDPLQALDWLADPSRDIRFLITDYDMPPMDGLVLIERARAHRPGLPAILLTGRAPDLPMPEGVRLFQKPARMHALIAAVRPALDQTEND
ncbi:MAG: response regulator [Mariprofundaceae bacterium]